MGMPSAKYSLKQPSEKSRFKADLLALGGADWSEKPEQYCDYRLDGKAGGGWLRAKQFSNGTLYLEASTDDLLNQMTALLSQAPVAAKPAQTSLLGNGTSGSAAKAAGGKSVSGVDAPVRGLLDIVGAYVGTDESGKGDYFGPLVVAGVRVDDQTCAILTELGVMDSKKLNEKQIGELYRQIIDTVGEKAVNVVEIGPAKYNELYERFKSSGKNLNHLLAWGHATCIENLLTRYPDCTQAIADQFGNERYIISMLKDKGKGITLHQTHKAEANVGVAAASIIARHRFVRKLWSLSDRFGVKLPFGASPQVKAAAKVFIQTHGREALREVAKLHFKTTQEL